MIYNDEDTSEAPYDLMRFVKAQKNIYEQALKELQTGKKTGHWMWFIFPQIRGLGFSSTSKRYAIAGPAEAKAYFDHPLLGSRLITCAQAILLHENRSATEILGSPDAMKLQSSATLFADVALAESVFAELLQQFFAGKRDIKTLQLLATEQ